MTKIIYYFRHCIENAINLVVTCVEGGSNTEITHSVREEKERSNPVTVTFTREELEQYTRGIIGETSAKTSVQPTEIVYKNRYSYRVTSYKLNE
ncbi:hypothetical protein PMEGAPR185_52190 [Priestia megaterium]